MAQTMRSDPCARGVAEPRTGSVKEGGSGRMKRLRKKESQKRDLSKSPSCLHQQVQSLHLLVNKRRLLPQLVKKR